ncbi:MAG: hypothetical protein HYX54_05870 [Chloroflexi bacterium]|nr:hypothetical protein [Chloroflexota bacterium]
MSRAPRRAVLLAAGLAVALIVPTSVSASNSWGGYHWARTANPFTLKLGDRLTDPWHSYLATTSTDWSASSVLDTVIVPGTAVKKLCSASTGTVQVCNSKYGNSGWLGVAQVWISGSHITKGTVKVNDTYFQTSTYNTDAWRNLVMCQEVGHTLGLDHQDTNFSNPNLQTCMDYTNDPSTNQHPNQHDFDELGLIYGHLDSTATVGATTGSNGRADVPEVDGSWGRLVAVTSGGHEAVYSLDLGDGEQVITYVLWADR